MVPLLRTLLILPLVGFPAAAQSGDDIASARALFPPHVTQAVLQGRVPAPQGFDAAMSRKIGPARLSILRERRDLPSGLENDAAAVILRSLGADPRRLHSLPPGPPGRPENRREFSTRLTGSSYQATQASPAAGFFATGQAADIMLSGIGFDDSGGPLLFNHPAALASDGTRLLLSDRNNNRVLIWSRLPKGNTSPDLVLGQPDLRKNGPGTGPHQMNWPSAVSAAKGRVVVADSYNSRLLIWLSFPSKNGQAADLVIDLRELARKMGAGNFEWPWGVWTDGEKLAATSTHASPAVLIWNRFPTATSQLPDLILTHPDFGTPRYITSDGRSLIVWDHNARTAPGRSGAGSFFWKTFPSRARQAFDFFVPRQAVGAFSPEGRLMLLGHRLEIWNSFPDSARTPPDLSIETTLGGQDDGSSLVSAEGRLYVLRGNSNRVVGYNQIPVRSDQKPDFVIGSPSLDTNPLEENFLITNPVPASNGKSLFVSSDFDRKLYIWKRLPDQTGAHPDIVISLPEAPWQNALWKETLAMAGKNTVYVWRRLPLEGELPDLVFTGRIGGVALGDIKGIAMDERHFILADGQAGKVHVWKGIPTADLEPLKTLETGPATGRLFSDGRRLLVLNGMNRGSVRIYDLSNLDLPPRIVRPGPNLEWNMPGGAILAGERLLVADTGFGRVLGWGSLEEAVAGMKPTLVLGAKDLADKSQEIGRDKLFWPAALSYDGAFLWVGEFKFSGRILRFSAQH